MIKSGALRLAFQLSCARGIEIKCELKLTSLSFPGTGRKDWTSLGELSAECCRETRGQGRGGGGIGRTSLLLLFLFFWQEPSATRSAFNYRWRMMLALFLSVMSCTCKLQNILESHHCPLIPPLPSSHPPSPKYSDSSSLQWRVKWPQGHFHSSSAWPPHLLSAGNSVVSCPKRGFLYVEGNCCWLACSCSCGRKK